ncbi:putative transcriptional regulatory protein dep1 protein [Erysiphe neolycopersici]|uniref:Putative transcriptional regulatory protein dep1 protein n=1 Tax=Erysiphe neolycopersici TaxID=212602 RepID=A0A420HWZ6_9PEZI|nr:putative transcriptional regulatory protein dep1 protein [Erysiphe neolycopersici]
MNGFEEQDHISDKIHDNESLDITKTFIPSEVYIKPSKAPNNLDSLEMESTIAITNLNSDTRKRKRSTPDGTALDELNESQIKRTGTIMTDCDGYFNEDEIVMAEISPKFTAENIPAEEEGVPEEEESTEDAEKISASMNLMSEIPETDNYPGRIDQKEKFIDESDNLNQEEDLKNTVDQDSIVLENNQQIGEMEMPVNEEEDEDEIAIRNEEATERKRTALDRLGDIERQFSIFRERLYEERLKQLNDEDHMLRQPQPSHPKYLPWLQCIDARRDERIRIAEKQHTYKLQCLKKVAVAQRSQILAQYQQEIRSIREKKLEQLGEQWYKIQNDRRSSAGVCPEFSLKFPRKKSQQLSNHIAYCNEVSVLSGVAKYVGFPAAPNMAPASATELEEDLEKIGRSKRYSQASLHVPLHELAALRAASSNIKFKAAEEQYLEQTSWANTHHQLNSHLMQRQVSSQVPRTVSPLAKAHTPLNRLLPQQGNQNCGSNHQNIESKETLSPKNSIEIPDHNQKILLPYPGNRQLSLSPHSNQSLTNLSDSTNQSSKTRAIHSLKSSTMSPVATVNIDFLRESRLSA